MFARIAPRYRLVNRLISLGQDAAWRREVIGRAALPPHARLLDIGSGTGDLAVEAVRACPDVTPVAADFTLAMMQAGRKNAGAATLRWAAADAARLPFVSGAFDAVVSGFLLRNTAALQEAITEQRRVLKKGGRLVCLDTTRPRRSFFSPLIWLHYHAVIPTLGRLITGDGQAYRYLTGTSENFLTAEAVAARLAAAGFKEVGYRRLMFGTLAIHWARK